MYINGRRRLSCQSVGPISVTYTVVGACCSQISAVSGPRTETSDCKSGSRLPGEICELEKGNLFPAKLITWKLPPLLGGTQGVSESLHLHILEIRCICSHFEGFSLLRSIINETKFWDIYHSLSLPEHAFSGKVDPGDRGWLFLTGQNSIGAPTLPFTWRRRII